MRARAIALAAQLQRADAALWAAREALYGEVWCTCPDERAAEATHDRSCLLELAKEGAALLAAGALPAKRAELQALEHQLERLKRR